MAGTNPAMTLALRWLKEPEALYRTRPIKPFTHFLARLEKRYRFLINRNMGPRAGVPSRPSRTVFYRKGAEATEFDPVALCHCGGDLAKDRVDDILDVALIKMGILGRNALNEF
jgi:hypothetical protein